MLNDKVYVPVAYVLQTETEFHDVYRSILLSIIDVLRTPCLAQSLTPHQERIVQFSELLTHLAFLKTVPPPPFNSLFRIEWPSASQVHTRQLQVISLREGPFNQVPHKSELPIKALFECLDIQNILTCWKALLFDRTLVLVSTQA